MPWKLSLTIGCVYEVVALYTPLPTITTLVHRAKSNLALRFLVWLGAGAAVWHFYVEEGE